MRLVSLLAVTAVLLLVAYFVLWINGALSDPAWRCEWRGGVYVARDGGEPCSKPGQP